MFVQRRTWRSRIWRGSLSALVGALALAVFFRIPITSGFDRVFGDHLDGFIQLSLMQHWANVVQGVEPWNQASYFYPWPDTLGYNDGYLLLGLPYALARALSLDPLLAETAAFVAVRAVGFVGFVLFATEVVGLGLMASLLGAALTTIASNAYLQSPHGQLLTASLAPLLGWLLWRTGQAITARRDAAALAWGWSAAALFGAWLLTGFYTAWFTALLVGLMAAATLAFTRVRPILRWPALAIAGAFAISAVPFALVYLPKARETGMHGFGELLSYSPSLLDYVHVGRGNLVFGWLDGWLTDTLRPGFPDYSEHSIGFSPALLVIALLGAGLAWRERARAVLPVAIALATLGAFALSVRVGTHTLWYYVYAAVPGAGAVRVVSRFALVLTFPITLLGMLWFDRLRRPWLAVPLAALLIAEEFTAPTMPLLDRPAALAFLAAIPPAPVSCRAFYTLGTTASHATGTWIDASYPHNTDAMLIAALRQLPTINGISTFNPPDWALTNPASPAYVRAVRLYLDQHGLERGICGLDLQTHVWHEGMPAAPVATPLAPGVDHPFGSAALDPILDGNWEAAGPVGRWTTGDRATMYFTLPDAQPGQKLTVDFFGLPIVWNDRDTSPITLRVNGRAVTTWQPVPERQHLRATFTLLPRDTGPIELSLDVERPRSPSELGLSPDSRRLGFFVLSFRIEPADSGS